MISSFRGSYSFLSNFHPCDIYYHDLTYPSAEHAFQAAKTFSRTQRKFISLLPTAAQAKREGRNLVVRADWEEAKLRVMEAILREKFRNPVLRNLLQQTSPHKLIEGNTWGDTYWGMVYQDKKWVGENHLGLILMRLRKDTR